MENSFLHFSGGAPNCSWRFRRSILALAVRFDVD